MNRITKLYHIVTLLLLLVPGVSRAQYDFDVMSVNELIDDHKRMRSVLLARSGIEQANQVLHQYSKEASEGYDSLNVKLDKYTKCFDVIDLIYTSGATVFNVKNTYSDVSKRITKLKKLLETFVEECTLRGDILTSDEDIITACTLACDNVYGETEELLKSLLDLAKFATGAQHITTEGMMTVLGEINDCLDNIRAIVDHTYYFVWKYVTIRTHFWKKSLWQAKTIKDLGKDAFDHWKWAGQQIGY